MESTVVVLNKLKMTDDTVVLLASGFLSLLV